MTYARLAALFHARIADGWLERWEGLDDGLPRLFDGEPAMRDVVDHLLAAGRVDDVHRLLAAERRGVNAWFAAHARSGRLKGYLRDVDVARQLAAAQTDRDLAAGRLAPSFGLELRYGLVAAHAGAVAMRPMDARLAARQVDGGFWPREALADVPVAAPRTVGFDAASRAGARALALARIAPQLTQPERRALEYEILEAATEARSVAVWMELIEHLPERWQNRCRTAGLTAHFRGSDGVPLGVALAAAAPALPVGHALDVAARLRHTDDRAALLAALAPRLTGRDMRRALTMAHAIRHAPDQLIALTALAPHAPPAARAMATTTAQELADRHWVEGASAGHRDTRPATVAPAPAAHLDRHRAQGASVADEIRQVQGASVADEIRRAEGAPETERRSAQVTIAALRPVIARTGPRDLDVTAPVFAAAAAEFGGEAAVTGYVEAIQATHRMAETANWS